MNKIEIIQPQKFKSVPFNRSVPTQLISHSQRLEICVFLESLCQHKRPAHVKSALRPAEHNEPQNLIGRRRLERGMKFNELTVVFTEKIPSNITFFPFWISGQSVL